MPAFYRNTRIWSFLISAAGPPPEAIVGAQYGQVHVTGNSTPATLIVNGVTIQVPSDVVWPLPNLGLGEYEVTQLDPGTGGEMRILFTG